MSWDVTKFRVGGCEFLLSAKTSRGALCPEADSQISKSELWTLRFSRWLIRAGLSLALLLMVPGHPASAQSQGTELFGRVIEDIQYIQDDTGAPLARAPYDRCIELKRGVSRLTRTDVKAAIQALYDIGSFSEISASAKESGNGVVLEFHLRLNSYFNRFFISGDVDLGGRSPVEAIALPVGERFTVAKLEESRQAVLRFMHEQGFYQAQVTARTTPISEGSKIDTAFEVQPGLPPAIRSLEIHGVPSEESAAILQKLGWKAGQKYDRDRFHRKLEGLRKDLIDRGFLGAEPQLEESYNSTDNAVALDLTVANFGQVRVEVGGFKIPREQLSRLLPVLSGEGLRSELIDEGALNLRQHLEERGYPEAGISIHQDQEPAGVRLLRYDIERGRRVTVGKIWFRGTRAFSNAELLSAIQIQPARFLRKSTYSISKLDSDVESLQARYRGAGYLSATVVPLVESLNGGDRLQITFECFESPLAKVRSVRILADSATGKVSLPENVERSLVGRMRLQEGKPYSPLFAEQDRQAILAAYNDEGFLQPVVSYRAVGAGSDDTYDVEFQISEGIQSLVDRVVVIGAENTRNSVIEKRLKLKQDEALSLGKMLETQQALYSTGVFDLVRVTPQNPESNAAYQNVIVRLQEAKPITLRYGIGYQEREKLRGLVELSHLNILGLGRRADLRFRGSAIEQAGAISLQQPQIRFLPVDSYFVFSGSFKKEVSYDVRRFDLSYQYSHTITNHAWGLLRYSFTNVHASDVPPDFAREDTSRNLSTISAIYLNDTRDDYLDPEKGFFSSTDLGLTSKLKAQDLPSGNYVSLFTQNVYYRKLADSIVMAAIFRFGIKRSISGDSSIPLSERFFAGGGSTLRGFTTDMAGPLDSNNEPIGGNALLIGNVELRVPLVSRFQLVGFYDTGNVFTSVGAIRLSDFSHTAGIGLRVKTPLGPIRLDYGVNLNLSPFLRSIGYKPGHFFLTIGTIF
jgi:outer membrane protein insertion porin family